jgi:hypothetical protein
MTENRRPSNEAPDDGFDPEMTPEERAYDLGLAQERTFDEIEADDWIEEMRARNPHAFEFGRIIGETMKEIREGEQR